MTAHAGGMSIAPTIARQVITAVPQGSRAIAYGERARDPQRELMGETARYVEPERAGKKGRKGRNPKKPDKMGIG
jgi:hypothetical protein